METERICRFKDIQEAKATKERRPYFKLRHRVENKYQSVLDLMGKMILNFNLGDGDP